MPVAQVTAEHGVKCEAAVVAGLHGVEIRRDVHQARQQIGVESGDAPATRI